MLRWSSVWETGAGADLYRSAGEWAARFGGSKLAPASWAKVAHPALGSRNSRGLCSSAGVNEPPVVRSCKLYPGAGSLARGLRRVVSYTAYWGGS